MWSEVVRSISKCNIFVRLRRTSRDQQLFAFGNVLSFHPRNGSLSSILDGQDVFVWEPLVTLIRQLFNGNFSMEDFQVFVWTLICSLSRKKKILIKIIEWPVPNFNRKVSPFRKRTSVLPCEVSITLHRGPKDNGVRGDNVQKKEENEEHGKIKSYLSNYCVLTNH